MKKILSVFCLVLVFCLFAPLSYAANSDTLVSWDIKISTPDDTTAVLKGDEYYIYTGQPDSIPYVMLRPYRYDSEEDFLEEFTDYMRGQYSDLKVTQAARERTLGGKACLEIDYSYTISGYTATDRRIAVKHGDLVYMFASKEIAELGMTVGSLLEDTVANAVFLSEEENGTDEASLSAAYLYCQKDGMPKYWLDFSGTTAENAVLHCLFRSSDPTFYNSYYILDLDSAEVEGDAILFRKVEDSHGFDHSNWFTRLSLCFDGDTLVMEVERDEKTLAGGSEDNVLTGTYRMNPVGEGPFSAEQLGKLAQLKYLTDTGFYPPEADTVQHADGSFTVHLFEIVALDGVSHTATSAWYTVDAFGVGANDLTGEAVDLIPYKTAR